MKEKLLLFTILAFLIGPNIKIGSFLIQDIIFLIFALILFLSLNRKKNNEVDFYWFFYVPAVIIFISLIGKILIGLMISSDEINNLLRGLTLFIISFITLKLIENKESYNFLLKYGLMILSLSLIYLSVLGILQFYNNNLYISIFSKMYEKVLSTGVLSFTNSALYERVTSVFHWANSFGFFIAVSLTIILFLNKFINKLLVYLTITLALFALILTNSRASFLLVLISFSIFLFLQGKKKLLLIILIFLTSIYLIFDFTNYINGENYNRLYELWSFITTGSLPANIQVRLDTLSYLPQLVLQSDYLYFGYPMQIYESTVFISWDNQYLGYFIKYGLLSIPFIIYSVIIIYYPLKNIKKVDKDSKLFLTTAFTINLLIFIGGFSQDTFFTDRWREFYFFIMPLILSVKYHQ